MIVPVPVMFPCPVCGHPEGRVSVPEDVVWCPECGLVTATVAFRFSCSGEYREQPGSVLFEALRRAWALNS